MQSNKLYLLFVVVFLLFGCKYFQASELCNKVWVPNYSNLDIVISRIGKSKLLNSHELHLNCNGTYEYVNICNHDSWCGSWTYDRSARMLLLISHEPGMLFPRSYSVKKGRLIGELEFSNGRYKEVLFPL